MKKYYSYPLIMIIITSVTFWACEEDQAPFEPEQKEQRIIAGVYILTSIAGQPLPYKIMENDQAKREILSEKMRLLIDRTYLIVDTLRLTDKVSNPPTVTLAVDSIDGTYSITDSIITFQSGNISFRALYSNYTIFKDKAVYELLP